MDSLVFVALLSLFPAQSPQTPNEAIRASVIALGNRDPTEAIRVLDEALAKNPPAEDQARLLCRRGIALESSDRRVEILLEFHRALAADANVELPGGLSPKLEALFACAKQLKSVSEEKIEKSYGVALHKDPPRCEAAVLPKVEKEPPTPPVVEVKTESTACAERSTWPLWLGTGVTVAASGVGAGFGAATISAARDEDPASDPRSSARIANVAWGTMAVAAAATGIWSLTHFLGDDEPAADQCREE